MLRELCAAAEFVGAETDYSRDMLAARCPESRDKIFRVYNGIDLDEYRKVTSTAALTRYGIDPEIPAIVLVVSGAHSDLVLMEAHRRFRPVLSAIRL